MNQEQEGKIIKIKNEILDYVADEAVRRRLGRALEYLRDPNKTRVVVNAIKNNGGYVGVARSLANLAYELYPGNAKLLLEWCKFEDKSDPGKVMNEIKQFFDRESIDLLNMKDRRKVFKNLAKEYWEAKEIARQYAIVKPIKKEKQIGYFPAASSGAPGTPIINDQRLTELRSITSSRFDLTRLIRLSEELNFAFSQNCFFAAAMLTRAILDHVPPVFNMRSFSEIANNYKGSRSFKEAMEHLDKAARKIADAHLHVPIRSQEVLPTASQVNFAPQLDLLLSEIVRIL